MKDLDEALTKSEAMSAEEKQRSPGDAYKLVREMKFSVESKNRAEDPRSSAGTESDSISATLERKGK